MTVAQALPGIKTLYNICSLLRGLQKNHNTCQFTQQLNVLLVWVFFFLVISQPRRETERKFLVDNTWQAAIGTRQHRARGLQEFKEEKRFVLKLHRNVKS